MTRMDVAAAAAVVISALSALGCSDPPEPPARGGLKVQFEAMPGSPTGCITGSSATEFGVGNPTPDQLSIGLPVISGEDETDVSCSVAKNGTFRASISAPNVTLDLRRTGGQPASISAYAPSATLNVSGTGCTLYTEAPYAYYPGEMFIGFDCPNATNPDWGTQCRLVGNLVVLRCAE
jgi:hypothetical protein